MRVFPLAHSSNGNADRRRRKSSKRRARDFFFSRQVLSLPASPSFRSWRGKRSNEEEQKRKGEWSGQASDNTEGRGQGERDPGGGGGEAERSCAFFECDATAALRPSMSLDASQMPTTTSPYSHFLSPPSISNSPSSSGCSAKSARRKPGVETVEHEDNRNGGGGRAAESGEHLGLPHTLPTPLSETLETRRHAEEPNSKKNSVNNLFVIFEFQQKRTAQQLTAKLIHRIDKIAAPHATALLGCTLTSVPFDSNTIVHRWTEGGAGATEQGELNNTPEILQTPNEKNSPSDNRDTSWPEPSEVEWNLVEAPQQMRMEDELSELTKQQKLHSPPPSVPNYIIPKGAAELLDDSLASQICQYLPPTVAIKTWHLAFCPKLHGISFSTLYRNVSDRGACILLVKDTKGVIFGGFSSEPFHMGSKYYGSGEMFVFTFKTQDTDVAESEGDSSQLGPIRVFYWSTSNTFFLFSDKQTIAIGGGGHYAITIDRDLLIGSSTYCPTFDSPCLSSTEDFVVRELQVWVFEDY